MLLRRPHRKLRQPSLTEPERERAFISAQAGGPARSALPPPRSPRSGGPGDDSEGGASIGAATKTRTRTKRPNLYRVLLLNDDYTPMEFVVLILQEVFNKSREDAWTIMLHVHQKGVGECGVFPFEVAETKVTRVMDIARKNQHPLQCVMEKQ
jgi:ATP-dependent Clp protease adaptor protein ClpS